MKLVIRSKLSVFKDPNLRTRCSLSLQPRTATYSVTESSYTGASALIALWPGVGLQTHMQGGSGQVQEKALIIGWQVRPGLRWGWAVTPEEDTQNELLHQKLRLATSMHVWAIFQMSISRPQRKPWRSCYHKQLE